MGVETNNTKALEELLTKHRGGDPVNVLTEALKQVEKEEAEQKQTAAVDLLRKAKALQNDMNQKEREFNGQKKKFDKELGKMIKKLQNMVRGQPAPDEDDDEEEKKD